MTILEQTLSSYDPIDAAAIKRGKPTAADIRLAIANAKAKNWLDPSRVPHYWACILHDTTGESERTWNGHAHCAAQAMAMAWLHVQAPDALIEAAVDENSIEFEVPAGWRFELTPPSPTLAAAIAWISENFHEFDDVA